MSKLPRRSGQEVVRALEHAGFVVWRVRGSHHILKPPDGRRTVLPVHSGEIIGPGLLKRICADADILPGDLFA